MNQEVRDRALLPLAIPVGILLFIGLGAFGLSRVLLKVPALVATAVALMVALNLLIGSAMIALGKKVKGFGALLMAGVVLVPVAVGIAVAGGFVEVEGEEGKEVISSVSLSANNIAFEKTEIEIPAGQEASLEFDNLEGQPHNVAIYLGSDATGTNLFRGEIVTGPKKITYHLPAFEAGSYYFRCDVHPTMNGTVKVG